MWRGHGGARLIEGGPPAVVDIHTHILPAEVPDYRAQFGYGDFVTIHHEPHTSVMYQGGEFFRRVDRRLFDPEARLEDCDRHGVDVQVLSTVPVMFSYWAKPEHGAVVARFLNEDIAGLVRTYPDRFIGLGTVPLQDPDRAVAELIHCVEELGLVGIEIGTHCGSTNLNAPELFPLFEAAADLGASVFVHPWDMMAMDELSEYWMAWLVGMPAESARAICSMVLGGVFERLPALRVAFAHGGGSFPGTFGRIQHGYEARPDLVATGTDLPPREQLGRFWVDSVVHDQRALDYLIDLLGDDRICLGTDFPFPLGEPEPSRLIRSLDADAEVESALLAGNALEWLGEKAAAGV